MMIVLDTAIEILKDLESALLGTRLRCALLVQFSARIKQVALKSVEVLSCKLISVVETKIDKTALDPQIAWLI